MALSGRSFDEHLLNVVVALLGNGRAQPLSAEELSLLNRIREYLSKLGVRY